MELITIMFSTIALIISVSGFIYTLRQNKRRIDVNIKLNLSEFEYADDPNFISINLSAFNSGYRSVALLDYYFFCNGEKIKFSLNRDLIQHPVEENEYDVIEPKSEHKFPHVLKEGEIVVTSIDARDLAISLKRRKFNGKVKISGQFITAHNKKYMSKPLNFNMDNWV